MVDAITGELQDRRVLVVEDEYMIAINLADALERYGVQVVGPAASVADALGLMAAEPTLHAAVLDINLGAETAYPVADELIGRGVPFVFATGYSAIVVPTAYANVPRVEKLVDAAALARTLAQLIGAANQRRP